MEASFALAAAAVTLALPAGYFSGVSLLARLKRGGSSVSSLGVEGGLFASVCRNGLSPLRSASGWLLRFPGFCTVAEECVGLLRKKSLVSNPLSAGTLVVAGVICVAALSYLASFSLACVVAVVLCAVLGLLGLAKTAREKRDVAFREEIPDVIRSLIVCFSAGMSLLQAAKHLSAEHEGEVRDLFEGMVRVLDTGGTTAEAICCLKDGSSSSELAFVAVALEVQHKSGGGVVPILESAKEAAQQEIELARAMRVQTAQARLSARIVTVMPFILVALFSLVSEGFLDPFFESVTGIAMLSIALIMQAAGVIAVRQMLKVS